jgi:hypothetical protein
MAKKFNSVTELYKLNKCIKMETKSNEFLHQAENSFHMPIPQRFAYHVTQPPFLNIAFVPIPVALFGGPPSGFQVDAVAKAVGERKRGRRPKWPFIPK